MRIILKKIIIAGLLAACLGFTGRGTVLAADNYIVLDHIRSLKQQILLLQMQLIYIQIADLQAQLDRINFKKCTDGTLNGQCSAVNVPKYCDGGALVNDCGKCGCPPDGSFCASGNICKGANLCADGTRPGKCSANRPGFCLDATLGFVDDCRECGCPAGDSCRSDGGCR